MILPIRTESTLRSTPYVNYLLIAANLLVFLLLDEQLFGPAAATLKRHYLLFDSVEPAFHQFFTYQFVHADVWHLFGNLLFLWVFGNGVNGKMGDIPYLLFYLAGGVFAAWGWAVLTAQPSQLLGASGAIAAVTTAYLALFPRSRVTVLVWVFIIYFFEVSAMVVIGLKIIVWDNIIGPSLSPAGNVATLAHLAGYLFGFAAALGMLLIRAIPRDQFDILALWRRWNLRREFRSAMSGPGAAERAQFGSAARVDHASHHERADEEKRMDRMSELRVLVGAAIERQDMEAAVARYRDVLAIDPMQCLSELQQLAIGRELYRAEQFAEAAAAFDLFVKFHPQSREVDGVRLLLGLIYARDLHRFELADEHLTRCMKTLHDEGHRAQCLRWLTDVRAALGRPSPEV